MFIGLDDTGPYLRNIISNGEDSYDFFAFVSSLLDSTVLPVVPNVALQLFQEGTLPTVVSNINANIETVLSNTETFLNNTYGPQTLIDFGLPQA